MSQIIPNLIVASFEESFDDEVLSLYHISHILNVAEELHVSERVGRMYAKFGVADDCDKTDIRVILSECLSFIKAAIASGGTVLVHCLEGKSRSVCVVLCHLVFESGFTFEQAFEHIKTTRPNIDVFPAYKRQCEDFVRQSCPDTNV